MERGRRGRVEEGRWVTTIEKGAHASQLLHTDATIVCTCLKHCGS